MGAIVGQADQYAIFDAPPRRDRVAYEAPSEIIREYSRGQTVGVGMLNPRRVAKKTWCPDCQSIVQEGGHDCGDDDDDDHRKEAVNTYHMPPDDHAYHEDTYFDGPGGFGGAEKRHFNPNTRSYEPTDADEASSHRVMEDDDSGYNWGPEPRSRLGFNRQADGGPGDPGSDLNGLTDFYGNEDPELFTYMFGPERRDPRTQVIGGLGLLSPGSRVGLPYNGTMIPGVVTHFSPDSKVGIRWHDGQHSVEEPGDVRPL